MANFWTKERDARLVELAAEDMTWAQRGKIIGCTREQAATHHWRLRIKGAKPPISHYTKVSAPVPPFVEQLPSHAQPERVIATLKEVLDWLHRHELNVTPDTARPGCWLLDGKTITVAQVIAKANDIATRADRPHFPELSTMPVVS